MTEKNVLWLGDEASLALYTNALNTCLSKFGVIDGSPQLFGMGEDDEPPNPVGFEVIGNVGVISVVGSTISRKSFFSRYFGVPSYDDIKERFIEANEEPSVEKVLYVVDSSGGHAEGVKGLSQFIRQFNNKLKPVVGHSSSKALSAGYWTVTAGQKVTGSDESRFGSIGALMVHFDYSESLKQQGVKVSVFRSAPYKALVTPYEPLNDKSRAEIEGELKYLHDLFVNGVAENRGMNSAKVSETIANGKVYRAEQARSFQMIDSILSFEETVGKLNAAR